jgi:hypothetical protein
VFKLETLVIANPSRVARSHRWQAPRGSRGLRPLNGTFDGPAISSVYALVIGCLVTSLDTLITA